MECHQHIWRKAPRHLWCLLVPQFYSESDVEHCVGAEIPKDTEACGVKMLLLGREFSLAFKMPVKTTVSHIRITGVELQLC